MIPVGGASPRHPALFIIRGRAGKAAVAIISHSTPALRVRGADAAAGAALDARPASWASPATSATSATGATSSTTVSAQPDRGSATSVTRATAFPFILPAQPGKGGTQALAVGTKTGGVTYDLAYSLVTVTKGAPVTQTDSAYALADCQSCTTVAVAFQVVLVVGESKTIAPINTAEALNDNCPACVTTAIADQIVVTLKAAPSQLLLAKLNAELRQLNLLSRLGTNGTPTAITAEVSAVQQEIDGQLEASGLLANGAGSLGMGSGSTTTPGASSTSGAPTSTGGASGSAGGQSPPASTAGPSSTTTASGAGSNSGTSTTSTPAQTATTSTTSPASSSTTATSTTTPSDSSSGSTTSGGSLSAAGSAPAAQNASGQGTATSP
jgi:putative peptide zinc metalloprotease protein